MNMIRYIVLFILTITITIGSFGTTEVHAAGKISSGSSIAEVPLEGLTMEEATTKLQTEVANWMNGEDIVFESEYESFALPRSIFIFDIDASLQELEEKTKRHWTNFFMKEKNVSLPIQVTVDHTKVENWPEYVDVEETITRAELVASELGTQSVAIEYVENTTPEQEIVASVQFSTSGMSEATVEFIVNELNEIVIPASETFSLLDSVSYPDGMGDIDRELDFVASAIYALALHTNFEIIERHSQEIVPSYSEPGIEANVNKEEKKDFILYNPNEYAFTLQPEYRNEQLTLSFLTQQYNTSYTYQLENKKLVEPKTIYRYSDKLYPGEKEVVQTGKDGVQVEVFRVDNENDAENKELMSREYYPPQPEVIVTSTTQPTLDDTENIEESLNRQISNSQEELLIQFRDSLNANGKESENDDLSENVLEESNVIDDNSNALLGLLFLACMTENTGDVSTEEGNSEEFNICDFIPLLLMSSMASGDFNIPDSLPEVEEVETEADLEAYYEQQAREKKVK